MLAHIVHRLWLSRSTLRRERADIDQVLGKSRQPAIGIHFVVQTLLQNAVRLDITKDTGKTARRAVTRHLIVGRLLGDDDQSGIQRYRRLVLLDEAATRIGNSLHPLTLVITIRRSRLGEYGIKRPNVAPGLLNTLRE